MKLITTSWDDGCVEDFRLAELLEKYNLKGTFYIPASNNEQKVMSEKEIVELSRKFEIGGHTMKHTSIDKVSEKLFSEEIQGCYTWLADLIGQPPVSFCFPRGIYNQEAVEYTLNCGFGIIRTTELLNPWFEKNNPVIPTTLQVFKHSELTYYKHLLKRFHLKSLLLYLKSNRSSSLQANVEYYLNFIQEHGGCFHLWGHSWEIEEFNLWRDLENLFKIMSNIPGVEYVNNKELLKYKN
jgi:peptidoglycan/xylan/chitin deacetylase (PgdA/CDA1 family)